MTVATAVPVVNEAGGGQVWFVTLRYITLLHCYMLHYIVTLHCWSHLLKIFSFFVSTGHTMWKSE